MTPAALQGRRALAARRWGFLALNLLTVAALGWGVANVFGAGGWSISDVVMTACFLLGAPWTVLGVWNALIGVFLLHGRRDGMALAAPHLAAGDGDAPLALRTAIAMTLCNEDPTRSFSKLVEMRRSLDETGQGGRFDIFVLSDTTDPEIASLEERLFERNRSLLGPNAAYRRRTRNTGFKAGNVRDFLQTLGRKHDFYLPLDSDSLMAGPTILRMQRIMEAFPRIGILQSLVVGAPATSFFARVFQFGMRHGMRSYTMGAAWWQGDCGPYWGHNALIRVAPFRRHCRLPVLPGKPPLGGHILSHDQLEAVLMRRAGYEVRVLPVETESWEENPPTLMDFTKRDLRWCQGNMQYWRLLGLRGLEPVSRFQIFAAIMMYVAAPAWMIMTIAAAARIVEGEVADIDVVLGITMFFIMFAVSLVPKLLGMLDTVLTPGAVARYGGPIRFLASGLVETLMSVLMAPVVAFRVSIFLVGLAFGKSIIWGAQNRDAYRLGWADAARGLWPQTLFGLGLSAVIVGALGWGGTVWAAPMLAGLSFAIPFAVATASPALGRLATRVGLCAIPDEIARPAPLVRTGYFDAAEQGVHAAELPRAA
ncbi:glucans biosynthesis glucosyltransferase MdoH [Limibaculum sp. M0105]|uniref:Glucans biosynthesis glucosyltransferase H n=1 Tax=Thermohalobaculum xanthum TaxID=2753746 RepID=A0A8J7M715_9RHOB|nr:glucans biosynthesis glucosyltransferase MdoH [Thermohalobaculum xanthum]MBK0399724.1 glucans biosynthesis glucosyltransferase MdoH [Thermohalobaculum xanthum]